MMKVIVRNGFLWDLSEIPDYDAIILLHSTNADSMLPLSLLASALKTRRGKLVIFVGNEYCLMPEKISFIRDVQADFVASQLPAEAADWLYGECSDSKILCVPHALNGNVYKPVKPLDERETDIGFIGDKYSLAIGDVERTALADYFDAYDFSHVLKRDIRIGRKRRLPREQYVQFLNSIRGTIGAESGTYYLEKTDRTLKRVEAYLSLHPDSTFEDIHDRFFKDYPNPVSGKAISSRHFEAIGTKTCQILLEGHYNGILKANRHYISLKKDYANFQEVINRFEDRAYVKDMVDETYEYVMARHTYDNRIQDVWNALY